MSILNLRSKEQTITIDGNDIVLCSPKRSDMLEIDVELSKLTKVDEKNPNAVVEATRSVDDCYVKLLICSCQELKDLPEEEQVDVAYDIMMNNGGPEGELMSRIVNQYGSKILKTVHLSGFGLDKKEIEKAMKQEGALDPVTENTFHDSESTE